jgi:hypothetical protein
LETRGQLLLKERINIVLLILLSFPTQVPGITRYYRGASFLVCVLGKFRWRVIGCVCFITAGPITKLFG